MFKNKNVKLYPLKNKQNESYPAFKQSVIKEMVAIQNRFTQLYLKNDSSLIEYLKKQDFDVAITGNQNYESFIAAAADIRILRLSAFLPNVISEITIWSPSQLSWEYNLIMFDT
jgi:hypothetical protein